MTTLNSLGFSAPAFEADLAEVVQRLQRSVVVVRDGGRGAGSGVIWQSDGLVVTNHHVVPGEGATVTLHDGRSLEAITTLRDEDRDLAVLKIPASGLPAARIGDSDELRVGELVFAVGNPLGLPRSVTAGIISGLGDPAEAANGHQARLIQADVTLAPGNSGGLLARADGSVVGITAMFRLPGLALAIPSNAAAALLRTGATGRTYLGVTLLETPLPDNWSEGLNGPKYGLLVTAVAEASPAQDAGVLPGDLLVSLGGRSLRSGADLGRALATIAPSESVELGMFRGGRPHVVTVVLGHALAEAA